MNAQTDLTAARTESRDSNTASTHQATRVLGRFVADLRYDDLPENVRERAKLAVLDWAGSALAGLDSDSARKLGGLVEELGGFPEATVVGRRARLPALHAALLNGVQAAVYEVDDVHLDCRVHPGLPVVSAAFALAEREGAHGRRLIEAVVAGYEVIVRLTIALGVPHNNWWHSTGTAGAVGAAAAAAKLLGLSAEQSAGALGLGATQGAGVIDGTEGKALAAKHFHGGKAAQNGIWAALLARRDYLGSRTALEGEWGFLRAFAKGGDADSRALLDRLGEEWYILRTISKPFACCLSSHAGIHALIELVRTHDLKPDQVESIEAYTNPGSYYMIKNPDPRDELQAKFSLPFCLAAGVVHRDVSHRAFDEKTLRDPTVRRMMERVSLETRQEIGRIQTLVRIRTRDGQVLERMGERKSLDAISVLEKFRVLAKGTISPARAENINCAIAALDSQDDVRAVGSLLAAE
ncbi:MAG: MmgE/PrpD family protein [Betaproteobacteria bacterium]|nr:MmgE/PrpD family protein [Betaproteobacteria bacterium]